MLGFRCSPPHPVTDKGIERFAESGDNGAELIPNVLFPMRGIKCGGHDGFLTNPKGMMCRRRHRKARWLGIVSHKRNIKMQEPEGAALITSGHLCRAYETQRKVASISYALLRIFAPTALNMS